ncbi:Uncharacterised protein [Bordetella pertussis]|nr:Uncharacterised protein [Bordetella pertussis]CFW29687.1 Uncharacterised protein [Bordetella pertussis]
MGCGLTSSGGGLTGESPSAHSSTCTGPGFSERQFTPKISTSNSSRCTSTARPRALRLSWVAGEGGAERSLRIRGGVMCLAVPACPQAAR